MAAETPTPVAPSWTRAHLQVRVLAALTVLAVVLCYFILRPFLAPLVWAIALGVALFPVHLWLARKIKKPGLVAGVTVSLIAIFVVGAVAFVANRIAHEAAGAIDLVRSGAVQKSWSQALVKYPMLEEARKMAEEQFQPGQTLERLLGQVRLLVTGSFGTLFQLILCFFFLFFVFRDWQQGTALLRRLLPLTTDERHAMVRRLQDTIFATMYGTLAVRGIQGLLGGLMFWWLGLPGPLLWGVVMGLVSIIPLLGAFIIWVPAAVFLAATGAWVKAIILTVWGTVVIGTVDNVLYPVLVGSRLRMHTVPVFISVLGGLAVFGAEGLILGPLVLAFTDEALHIWQERTIGGRSAEAAGEGKPMPLP